MRTLAKLTTPVLADAYPRQRLFDWLDQRRGSPVIWVCAPPGAGKTTLISSYVGARGMHRIWYQIDAGDQDPATFFHYLREAAPRRKPPLPLLTPEYLPDFSGFTHRFFRELFQRLPRPAALVLDNFQDAQESGQLYGVVRDAAAEIPEGVNLFVISRSPPPAECTRIQVNKTLALLDWEKLRLTQDETRAIASLRGYATESTAHCLHQRSGGWAAGLTVLMEDAENRETAPIALDSGTPQAVFDYIASEIFDRAPAELRELWLRTACLPWFSAAMARQLTGGESTGALLENLYRRRYFIDRRNASDVHYQYHALFRDFLRAHTERVLTPIERQQLARQSARILEEHGDYEAAFKLYRDARDWESAARLILIQAPSLVGQGRWQTLDGWIMSLPDQTTQDTPWLLYWRGVCRALTDPSGGRSTLERAYETFVRKHDRLGQAVAASAIVDAYFFEWARFKPLDRWIDVLQDFLSSAVALPSEELELRLLSSTGLALMYRQPKNPFLKECVRRVRALLAGNLGPNEKIAAATFLFHYNGMLGDLEESQIAVIVTQALIEDDRVTPITRFWWWNWRAYLKMRAGEHPDSLALLNRADLVARENGLGFLQPFLAMCRASTLISFGQSKPSNALLTAVESGLDYLRPHDVNFFFHLRSLHALLRNNLDAALLHAQRAFEGGLEAGEVIWFPLSLEGIAVVLARRGAHDEALARLNEAAQLYPEDSYVLRQSTLLLKAYLAHLRGDQVECLENLKQGMRLGAEHAYRNSQHWVPGMMPTLCGLALRHRIQVDYVRDIIRRLALKPDSPDIEHWPWPVKIYTLGRFSLVVDDEPVEFARKAPKKPIALLKFIIAAGGRQVPLERAVDALWPDEEGDAAQKSFQITLHRLRKLLQQPDAVQLQQGRLSLNAALCWVDAWAFERLAARTDPTSDGQDNGRPTSVGSALTLYKGTFLAHDLEEPWTLSLRERLRTRYIRLIALQASRLIEAGNLEAAIACYRQGITADELAEEFYLGIMRCYQQLARPAEGLAVYQRLSRLLAIKLGVDPSPDAQTLVKTLRASSRSA